MGYLSKNLSEMLNQIGGKATGLNKLLALPDGIFSVPYYTIITVDAFLRHLLDGGFQFEAIKEYTNEQIENLMGHILYGHISEDVSVEIDHWVDQANKPLCVRSSCVAEDGEVSSSAGIYDTFLNISTRGDFWNCVRKVWASVFDENHIAYCKKTGSALLPMAVIVQELKCAAVSGVVLSDIKSTIIRATYGLGSGIVDGTVKSDSWEFDDDGIELYNEVIEKKEAIIPNLSNSAKYTNMYVKYAFFGDEQYSLRVIKPDERHAILNVALPNKLINECCIDSQIVKMIYKTVQNIKEHLGLENLDMEWCLDNDKNLHILQVRPLVAQLIQYKHNSDKYTAQPISGKIAYGNLCIINAKEDVEKLDKNKIAVMNWMPSSVTSVLMKSAGIIIRVWQNMSHFALLVREWDIPCIAAVEEYALKEGAYVKINGATGELLYLSNEDIEKPEGDKNGFRFGKDISDITPQWPLYIYRALNDIADGDANILGVFKRDNATEEYFRKIFQEVVSNNNNSANKRKDSE